MTRLLNANRPPTAAAVLLVLAAVPFAIAGFDHARLFHRGYDGTGLVGTLFLLNGIATGLALLLLVAGRMRLFALAVLAISVPSLMGIVLSHTGIGFLRFREGEWGPDAILITVCEVAATVLALSAIALGAFRDERTTAPARSTRPGVPAVLAGVAVVVVFAVGALGIGLGEEGHPGLDAAGIETFRQAIAAGGDTVSRGRALFATEGCSKCHAIAAAGYGGKLGPVLDTEKANEEPEEFLEGIVERDEASLMRTDYDERVTEDEAQALAEFVAAAAVGEG